MADKIKAEVKPVKKEYKDVAPVLYDLGITEAFVDDEKPVPPTPPTPYPELTKAKAEAVLVELKTNPCLLKVAQEVGVTMSDVQVIQTEAIATWGLKADGTIAI